MLFLVALGARDLWNPNEPIYGRAVAEMWERGDWLIPTVNNGVFAEKPILYYWLALAISRFLGGVSELSLRLPSALAGICAVLLTHQLVLPYAGRKRALLAGAMLATQYLVWWQSRWVEMDVLVLASTLGVLVPLSRMLDFSMPQAKAWVLAGVAAGLGFAAKGPVAWAIPGLVFFAYVGVRRLPPARWGKGLVWGALVALALAAPWYVLLWSTGHAEALEEVLLRQNFTRFVAAWDHDQPWYYYAPHALIDYLPWSMFVPVAFGLHHRDLRERRLDLLAWIWLIGTIVFFSLADSKRAPYILPIAPATVVLASGVLERLKENRLSRPRRRACLMGTGFMAVVLALVAVGLVVGRARFPPEMSTASLLSASAAALGVVILVVSLWRFPKHPQHLPSLIVAALAAVYMAVSLWLLPAANIMKSARPWALRLESLVAPEDTLVSFRFFRWRAGYPFYAGRSIPNLLTAEEFVEIWQQEDVWVLVEDNAVDDFRAVLGEHPVMMEHHFANRVAYLFSN